MTIGLIVPVGLSPSEILCPLTSQILYSEKSFILSLASLIDTAGRETNSDITVDALQDRKEQLP